MPSLEGFLTSIGDRSWVANAACRDVPTALFFPERGENAPEAKGICRSCPVRCECREYALANGEKFGIWGGMSERERRRVRRLRPRVTVRVELANARRREDERWRVS